MTQSAAKPRENPEPQAVRVPRHGRGRLKVGGRNPGSGRPPEVLRVRCREQFERILDELRDRDLSVMSTDELTRVGALLARTGIPAESKVEHAFPDVAAMSPDERMAEARKLGIV